MEPKQYDSESVFGCSRPVKACLVVIVALAALFIGLLTYTLKMPAVQGMVRCRSNMMDIGAALKRYHDANGRYPADLGEIRAEYLKDPSVLRCPQARSSDGESSYVYHRPPSGARGSFVILECRNHRFSPKTPRSTLVYLKSGIVKTRVARDSK